MNKTDGRAEGRGEHRFDALDLDGRLLTLLLAVLEEGSVTRAAQRLGVTQSAVSHLLDKLRAIVGDPLFVKSGRGIVPTALAQQLAPRARQLLDDLRGLAHAGQFNPATVQATFTVAANDLQRDLLLPPFLRRVRQQAPGLRLRVINSGAPTPEMLRQELCQLIITPRPPEAGDVVQKRLFEDGYLVFFDGSQRSAPASLAEYLAAEHVTVVHEPRRALDIDHYLLQQGLARRMVVEVPGFAGVAPFVRGSSALATLPGLLRAHLLRDLACAPPPLPCPPMPMFMCWHLRHQGDPLHSWLRNELLAVVPPTLPPAVPAGAAPSPPKRRRAGGTRAGSGPGGA